MNKDRMIKLFFEAQESGDKKLIDKMEFKVRKYLNNLKRDTTISCKGVGGICLQNNGILDSWMYKYFSVPLDIAILQQGMSVCPNHLKEQAKGYFNELSKLAGMSV